MLWKMEIKPTKKQRNGSPKIQFPGENMHTLKTRSLRDSNSRPLGAKVAELPLDQVRRSL